MGEIGAKVQGLLRRAKARKSSAECWLWRRWCLQMDLQKVENRGGRRRRRRYGNGKVAAPKGYLPIKVMEEVEEEEEMEMEVFVKAEMLNHPVVAELLRRAAEEYSYGYTGALRLFCDAMTLEDALNRAMKTTSSSQSRSSMSSRRRNRMNGEQQQLLLMMNRRVHP